MKHFKKILGALLLVAVPMVAWVGVAQAQRFATTVDEGQKVYSTLYSAGKTVDVQGEIFGDVFCAGQNVKIDATVHGDVICAGQDVTISGKIDGDIRAAGQLVSISATTTGSMTLAGSDVSLDADAVVGRDLTVAGQRSNVKGSVGRDVVASGSETIFNGKVGRNVKATGSNISLKENARIAGDFNYTNKDKVKKHDNAVVAGNINQTVPPARQGYHFNFGFYLLVVLALVMVAMAMALLFPRYQRRTSNIARNETLKTLLVGVVGGLVAPALFIGLCISLIGVPLGLTFLVAFLLAVGLSGPIAAYYLGRWIIKKADQPVLTAVVGSAVLTTTYFLPVVGLVFALLGFWIGFGSLLLDLKNHLGPGTAPAKAKAGK